MQATKVNVLVSFPYVKKGMVECLVEHADKLRVFIDSGAFTARNTGLNVTLDDYCEFLRALPFKPYAYFMLDVIGDAEATMRNYQEMRKRGFSPMPVFTPSAPFEHLDEFKRDAEVVGCGGLVEKYGTAALRRVREVFARMGNRNVHLLGYTKPAYVKHFRPVSCDSSSWVRSQRYGLMDLYIGRGEYRGLSRRTASKRPKEHICDAIRRLGFNVRDLQKESAWRGQTSVSHQISARSWIAYMADAERAIGTKIALVCADRTKVLQLLDAYDALRALTPCTP